jgi:hypothetical protein
MSRIDKSFEAQEPNLKSSRCQMTANEIVPQSIPHLKRAATGRGRDASQRLLATLAVFALTASIISIGICMVVIAQTVPAFHFVIQARPQ